MKQPLIRVILLLLVVTVWGAVVVRALKRPTSAAVALAAPTLGATRRDTTVRLEPAFHLERDPFLDGAAEAPRSVPRSTNPVSHRTRPVVVQQEKDRPWPSMGYKGMMRGGDGKGVAFLTISGKEHVVREGEMVQEIRLLTLQQDSVELEHHGSRRNLKRQ